MQTSTSDPARRIKAAAIDMGFSACAVTSPDQVREAGDRFLEFLKLERHGDMDWLVAKKDRRQDPRTLWPNVKSVVMLGMNYGPGEDVLPRLLKTDQGVISCYAQGRDYHDVVKKRLKQLARWMVQEFGGELKVFVDTAPVLEKPLAAAAGLGWQGKHTNLVSRDFGAWLFLGAIYTDLDLPADPVHPDRCGGCSRCLDICPTEAFVGPYQLDARRCISYLTIEHQGHIAAEFRTAMGNRIFGCDDCLAVCPWNKFAQASRESKLQAREELKNLQLVDLLGLDDKQFRQLFTASPVKRLGRDRFVRNVLIASGNSGDRGLIKPISALLQDHSALVRAMAVWALSQLLDKNTFRNLRDRYQSRESDKEVRAEWQAAAG
jgi:epoxyqueuosine reductase